MPIEVTMPRLSDTMQQGTIVKWNVKEGQAVKTGDTIADIETDKATMELQSFDDGTVAKLAVAEGQAVPVGTVIMLLAGAGENVDAAKGTGGAKAQAPEVQGKKAAAEGETGASRPAQSSSVATIDRTDLKPARQQVGGANGHPAGERNEGRVFASPLARKIAEDAGVDLGAISGSGPGGRIIRRDVEEVMAGGGGGAQAPPGQQPPQTPAAQTAPQNPPPPPPPPPAPPPHPTPPPPAPGSPSSAPPPPPPSASPPIPAAPPVPSSPPAPANPDTPLSSTHSDSAPAPPPPETSPPPSPA